MASLESGTLKWSYSMRVEEEPLLTRRGIYMSYVIGPSVVMAAYLMSAAVSLGIRVSQYVTKMFPPTLVGVPSLEQPLFFLNLAFLRLSYFEFSCVPDGMSSTPFLNSCILQWWQLNTSGSAIECGLLRSPPVHANDVCCCPFGMS